MTTIESACVAEAPSVSAALTVKLEVPVAVGVPVMAPALPRLNPVGREPEESDQVKPPVPPVAASVWLYAIFTVSAGKLEVVIATAALTTMESALLAVAEALSVTFAVKLDVPDAVGVPVIAPVDELRPSPVGRLPD